MAQQTTTTVTTTTHRAITTSTEYATVRDVTYTGATNTIRPADAATPMKTTTATATATRNDYMQHNTNITLNTAKLKANC